MKPEERIAAAQALLDMPLFHLLMGELETAAVNACVNARHTDHETRGLCGRSAGYPEFQRQDQVPRRGTILCLRKGRPGLGG